MVSQLFSSSFRLDLITLLLLVLSRPAAGQGCHLELRGQLGGKLVELETSGTIGLARTEIGEILVIDLTDPRLPRTLGRLTVPGEPVDLAIEGDRAIVAAGSAGVHVIDLEDPRAPTIVVSIPTPGPAQTVEISGDRAVVLLHLTGLMAIDLTDPGDPRSRGFLELPEIRLGPEQLGSFLWVVSERHFLHVVDVRIARSPELENTFRLDSRSYGIRSDGHILHVLFRAGGARIQTLDFTDPENPSPILPFDLSFNPDRFEVHQGRLILLDGTRNLSKVSFVNGVPAREVNSFTGSGEYFDLSFLGDQGILLDSSTGGYELLDLADPEVIELLDSRRRPRFTLDVDVQDSLAFVSDSPGGLLVLDVSDPEGVQPVGHFNTGSTIPSRIQGMARQGEVAFLAIQGLGLASLDVSAPETPRFVGLLGISRIFEKFAFVKDHIIFPDTDENLQVIRVSDPTHLRRVALIPLSGNASDLWSSGSLVFASVRQFGLQVFDLVDPTSPEAIGQLEDLASNPYGITGQGDRVYLADISRGLRVVDVSDPRQPVSLYQEGPDPEGLLQLQIDGDLLYARTRDRGLKVYDIRVPEAPRVIETLPSGDLGAVNFHVEGGRVYVASEKEGLKILDSSGCDASLPLFVRGDGDGDSRLSIGDIRLSLEYLFDSGPTPPCLAALDVNVDGRHDMSDPIATLSHEFLGTFTIPQPYPDCGQDILPQEFALSCDSPPVGCASGP